MVTKIKTAAVIGAGIMGGGIAALLAAAGIKTYLLDIVPPDLNDSQRADKRARNRIVKAGLDALRAAQPPLLMHPADVGRITIGNLEDDFQRLGECDWIVEAVVENLGIKQDLLARIQAVRAAGAIVSTNTSGIPLKSMSEGLSVEFCQHFLGTHFFNPVRYMHLLEIIPGEQTRSEVRAFMARFAKKTLGKGVVWAKDTPNFVGNRIGIQGVGRAMREMLAQGLSIPEADALLGPAVGRPKTAVFKTADLVGLDTLAHVAANTREMAPDDEAREDFELPEFVDRLIAENRLGKKTQAGFYKTDLTPEWKKIRKVVDPQTLDYHPIQKPSFACLQAAKTAPTLAQRIQAVVNGQDRGARYAWNVLASGLIYAANRIPEIADTIAEIDNAMRWGYNFEAGPFETWDAIGLEASVARMEHEGLAVPAKIKQMLADGHRSFYRHDAGRVSYYDFDTGTYKPMEAGSDVLSLTVLKGAGHAVRQIASASLVDLGDGVFCVEFHTKMNVITNETIDFMVDGIEYVDRNGVGLVIGNQAGGMPGAFSAGADLKYMAMLAQERKYSEMDAFLDKGQKGIQRARYAVFPVVAAPFGLTLGGGCEVCLGAADRLVAHADLFMGLVEVGVGLLPAGGGCLNLWKKMTATIPETVNIGDYAPFFLPVFMNIAMAKVSNSAADARASGFLDATDRIVFNRDHLLGEAKKEVLQMVAAGYIPPLPNKVRVMGSAAQGMVNAELNNMQAAKFISEHDALIARRIAYVLGGGDARANSRVAEETILKLERDAFIDLWKQPKTLARVEHMLKTGKPLRN